MTKPNFAGNLYQSVTRYFRSTKYEKLQEPRRRYKAQRALQGSRGSPWRVKLLPRVRIGTTFPEELARKLRKIYREGVAAISRQETLGGDRRGKIYGSICAEDFSRGRSIDAGVWRRAEKRKHWLFASYN